ncbi:MAG: hypothetical protein V1793_15800 [Pseudomonadota bacterium]
MDNDRSEKWLPILFFSIVGGLFVFFSYYLVANASNPEPSGQAMDSPQAVDNRMAEVQLIPPDFTTLTLTLDTEVQVNDKRFIYRGMEDNTIRIEVIIPALDPDRGYMYQVSMDRAEKGFSLSGRYFKLVSARQKRIRILRLESGDLC